jgi:hypothetical protein
VRTDPNVTLSADLGRRAFFPRAVAGARWSPEVSSYGLGAFVSDVGGFLNLLALLLLALFPIEQKPTRPRTLFVFWLWRRWTMRHQLEQQQQQQPQQQPQQSDDDAYLHAKPFFSNGSVSAFGVLPDSSESQSAGSLQHQREVPLLAMEHHRPSATSAAF